MIRSPNELAKPINEAVNPKTVVASYLVLAVTMVIHTIFSTTASTTDKITTIIISLSVAVMALFKMLDLSTINRRPRLYLTIYSLIIFSGIIFVSSAASPYIIVVMIAVIFSNVYFGNRGVLIVVTGFGLSSILKAIYLANSSGLNRNDSLNIAASFLVFTSVCMVFVNVQKLFNWDRDRLHETIKDSVVEEKRLRALVNNMTESVLVLDNEGIIKLYNAAALALFNTNNSLSDKPLDGFVRMEDEKGQIITTLDLLPKDNKPVVRGDIKIRYSQDDAASISVVATPIRPVFGEVRDDEGYVLTMRDISREKSLEEERDEFISVISHELRTPVTVAEAGVSNALLLAEKMPGADKITKSLQTAHDQSVFLANMLNDLSTFARAEKGTLETNLEEFDPRELLNGLVNDYRGGVTAKHMNIRTSVDPSTPLRLASNKLYIREILQNFITNAIKYSDKGTITIGCSAKDKGILFSVSDEGIGISTSDQKKVFEKFFRAEDYRTRSTNGTGLGLYIVKKLGKILDAGFEIQSEVGKGSTFSVYVPDKSSTMDAKKALDSAPVNSTHLASPAPQTSPTANIPTPINATPPPNNTPPTPANLPKQG